MPPEETAFHLDECLPPAVAKALRLVAYNISDATPAKVRGWDDEDLIPWLSQNKRVWITKDHEAKNAHMESIVKISYQRRLDSRDGPQALQQEQGRSSRVTSHDYRPN
jgi:hypothetical protein